MCKLVILIIHGPLLCGATGMLDNDKSLTSGYQLAYHSQQDTQYCVSADDVERSSNVALPYVVAKPRADSVPLSPTGECRR
jgi:hypothetical protein